VERSASADRRAQLQRLGVYNGWKDVEPGSFEMDLVANCGGRMEGVSMRMPASISRSCSSFSKCSRGEMGSWGQRSNTSAR
jgi:uncharacterized membrane protein